MKRRKKIGTICIMMLFCVISVWMNGKTVQAERNDTTIILDGNWVDGNLIEKGDIYFYEFSIPTAGTVNIEGQGLGLPNLAFDLWNKDITKKYWSVNVVNASIENPKTVSGSSVLEAGTYVVKVYSHNGQYTGSYRLRGTFVSADNDEIEPNDIFSQAQNISQNQLVTGLLSEDDDNDFYSFTLSQQQRVKFECNIYYGRLDFSVWDKDYKKVKSFNWLGGDGSTPSNREYINTLDSGTYYIKIAKDYESKYTVKYSAETPVTAVKLPKNKEMAEGETTTLELSLLPMDATNQSVTWETNDDRIVTVSEAGVLTAKAPGKATITVISNDNEEIKAVCTVTVNQKKNPVTTVKLPESKEMVVGDTATLAATILPADATNKGVIWDTDNGNIVAVSESGVLTAKASGKATITVISNDNKDIKAICMVTVKSKKVSVSTVKLPTTKTMVVGDTLALAAMVLPADATNKNVTWKTDDTSIITVSEKGVLTAKAPGKVTVTAMSKDNKEIKATCIVTVKPQKLSISKIKNISGKGMKLTWKKQDGISGYQIQYATNKSLKKAKSSKISSNSFTVKSLKKKKTYYVRVRAYKSNGKENYYGAWSKTKQIKVKK